MGQILCSLLKLIIFFPIVIALILWLGKLAEKYGRFSGGNSSMKVVERMALSKDNAIFIVKIGEKYYLVTSTPGKVEIVRELDETESDKIKLNSITDLSDLQGNFKMPKIQLPWKLKNK